MGKCYYNSYPEKISAAKMALQWIFLEKWFHFLRLAHFKEKMAPLFKKMAPLFEPFSKTVRLITGLQPLDCL